MIEFIGDVLIWIFENYKLLLWGFGALLVFGLILSAQRTMELNSWTDQKLEARANYLLHDQTIGANQEYWEIRKIQDRRLKERCKQSSKREWKEFV